MDHCFLDIEADNLLTEATTIWCIVAKINNLYHICIPNRGSVEYTLPPTTMLWDTVIDFMTHISQYTLVGHNIISYDLPLLRKLHGYSYSIDPSKLVDTHILSRLYNPDRTGHSLEYFGNLLNFAKGDHKDWSCMSQEMLDYCIRDVDLTESVYNYLLTESEDWNWAEAIKLEYNVWHIQQKQEQHGVLFDKQQAEIVLNKISEELQEIEERVIKEIPPVYKNEGEVKKVFNKDGSYTLSVKNWLERENHA